MIEVHGVTVSYKQGNFISLPVVEDKQEVLIAAVVAAVVAALHSLAPQFIVAPEPHFSLLVQVPAELDQDWNKNRLLPVPQPKQTLLQIHLDQLLQLLLATHSCHLVETGIDHLS